MSPISSSADLRALTLNVWGLWLVSIKRDERIRHLCNYLRDQGHTLDVVMLQEVWVDSDANLLTLAASEGGLEHSVHFTSGTFGSGLLTFSRHPIVASSFHRYSGAGDALAIICGDYLAAKGYGWVRIRLNDSTALIDLFNTHTHANYSHHTHQLNLSNPESPKRDTEGLQEPVRTICSPVDSYSAYRVSQMWELAQGIVQKHQSLQPDGSSNSNGVLLGGDLNSKPDSLEMALLLSVLESNGIRLNDAWTTTHSSQSIAHPSQSIASHSIHPKANGKAQGKKVKKGAKEEAASPQPPPSSSPDGGGDDSSLSSGMTCMSPECSFKSTRQIPERIDYLLSTMGATSCQVTLKKVPGLDHHLSYSDHFAVQGTFALHSYGPASDRDGVAKKIKQVKSKASGSQSGSRPFTEEEREIILGASKDIIDCGSSRIRKLRFTSLMTALAVLLAILGVCLAEAMDSTDLSLSNVIISPTLDALIFYLLNAALSAFSMVLVLKTFLIDMSQERALRLIASEMGRARDLALQGQ